MPVAVAPSQTTRQMTVTTPLGKDILLMGGFKGVEELSRLFTFKLGLFATRENLSKVVFDKLLGQEITVEADIYNGGREAHRYISGICVRFSQGNQDDDFTYYEAEIMPKFWLLSHQVRSRIFQQQSAVDIIKKIISDGGLDVSYQITGTFEKREYCVQYAESDFDFVSRLMEEEGIFYFFKFTAGGHQLIVANASTAHTVVDGLSTVEYETAEASASEADHVMDWIKFQEMRSGKMTLRDYNFQLPGNNLEAKKNVLATVAVGKVTHKLQVGGNDQHEIYDYPGGYAKRFDGIDKGGGEAPASLQKCSTENTRVAGLRMEEETTPAIRIQASSNCNNFQTGRKFTLSKHFDANGDYVLTKITHSAELGTAFRSGETTNYKYSNTFECIPFALPFRPERKTTRPVMRGVQTAVVVGPAGEDIFTDKYGRVKVQFQWDREGKNDANSSCWLRVSTLWAGKQWGMIHIPRIGQEVIVDFLEGDPDAPIIVGSVYNPKTMPPYKLPDHKTQSGVRSRSTLQGGPDDFNEIRFEDKKGQEQIFINAQFDMDRRVENDSREFIGKDEHVIVKGDRKELIDKTEQREVKMDMIEKIGGKATADIATSHEVKVGTKHAVDAGMEIHLKAGMKVVLEAGTQISLKVGGNFIDIGPAGVTIVGTMVNINSGGAAGAGGGASPGAPQPPDQADDGTKATKLA